jgi:hypothetical protein
LDRSWTAHHHEGPLGLPLLRAHVAVGRRDLLVAGEVGNAGERGTRIEQVRDPVVTQIVLRELGREPNRRRGPLDRVAYVVLSEDGARLFRTRSCERLDCARRERHLAPPVVFVERLVDVELRLARAPVLGEPNSLDALGS